ncbi:MAG: MMPL family transporter, partial [Myxococcales bacterium]|nr:MMPL family transporter [Myxococcales bacterium]
MAEKVFDIIIRYRVAVLVATLALGLGLAAFIPTGFDNSLRIWFLDDDPDVMAYDAFLEQFESDEFLAVAVVAPDVFQPDVLADIEELSAALEEIELVTSAESITSAETIEQYRNENGDRSLRSTPLYNGPPSTAEEIEDFRQRIMSDRLLADYVSEDQTAALILLRIPHFEDLDMKSALAREVRETVHGTVPDRETHLAGSAMIDDAMARYSRRDMAVFAPLTMLVICIATFLLFRSLWATVLPMVIIGLSLG